MKLVRPQPIGLAPFPVGHLLLPEIGAPDHLLDALLHGDFDIALPGEWQFLARAFHGDPAGAHQAIAHDDSLIGRYNRFLLRPHRTAYDRLSMESGGALQPLVRAAGYAFGFEETPPSAETLDGELFALVRSVEASALIEAESPFEAAGLLQEAIEAAQPVSPLLAAVLLNQLGELRLSLPGSSGSVAALCFRKGIDLAGETPLPMLRAQLWTNLGVALQQNADGHRAGLLEAIRCYQRALQLGIDRRSEPRSYAFIHNNLGLAYMAMPAVEASDQLRMGIAVQSFREALSVFDREQHPQFWASVQLNLANALQYLPSSHPAENLAMAVDAYEEVLRVRDKALDPVGYARTVLNQGNALAHLGAFPKAVEQLREAYRLFHAHGYSDEAETARQLIDQIERRRREAASAVAGDGCSDPSQETEYRLVTPDES